jgi:Fe2+ or Zn2+ uptake regulation protein
MLQQIPSTQAGWLEAVQSGGYRLTRPLRTIVAVMVETPYALSPLEVFDQARQSFPQMGLVTVYRSLEKLEQLALVQRVHQPNGCHRFIQAAYGHQHLLLCGGCGRATYFSGDDLDDLIDAIQRRTGYTIEEHWLQLSGRCAECRK